MFVTLFQMLKDANLTGMHLMIRPLSEGKLQLAMSSESCNWQADNQALKSALAQTLIIESAATELETEFTNALKELSETFIQAEIVSNAKTVKQNVEKATVNATQADTMDDADNNKTVEISDSENDHIPNDVVIGETVDDDLF